MAGTNSNQKGGPYEMEGSACTVPGAGNCRNLCAGKGRRKMKKVCLAFVLVLFIAGVASASVINEGMWVRDWVGWGETQHWTDISDILSGMGSFEEEDPVFSAWKSGEYQLEQNAQWDAIGTNTTWNAYQQGQIFGLAQENAYQWGAIAQETIARQCYDAFLTGKITETDFKSKLRDAWLKNQIDRETFERMSADEYIHKASIQRDRYLNKKIQDVNNASIYRDQVLGEAIDTERQERVEADRYLDRRITDNSNRISRNTERIEALEDPKFNIIGSLRIHDSRKWEIKAFAAWDVTNSRLDRYGLEFMFKLGPSYEERLINELQERIEALEAQQ